MLAKLKWNRGDTVKSIHIFFLCLLFVNVLVNSFQSAFIIYELDRKLIYFNIVGSIYIILATVLRLHKKMAISYFNSYLGLVIICISLNYYLSIGLYNNIISSIILLILISISIKDLAVTYNCKELLIFAFTTCVLATGILEGAIGVLQVFHIVPGLGKNIVGTFFNKGIYAIYMSITFSFALPLYVFCKPNNFKQKLLRSLALVNILLSIVVLPSTFSRSAWVAAICSSIFILIISQREVLGAIKFRTKLFLALLIAIIGLTLGVFGYKLKSSSADGRIVIWKTGLIALQENPLLGIGFGQVQYKFFEYQGEYFRKEPEDGEKYTDRVDFVFNDTLQFTIENGIVGLILFSIGCVMLFQSIKSRWSHDPFFLGAVSGIISVAVSSFFSYPLEMISICYLVLLFISMVNISGDRSEKQFIVKKILSLPLYAIVLLGCSYILQQQYKCIQSVTDAEKGQDNLQSENFKAAKTYLKRALENTPYQKKILTAYGLSQLNLKNYEASIHSFSEAQQYLSDPFLSGNTGTAYLRLRKYKQAEQQYLNAIHMAPNRIYFKYLLAKLYKETGDSVKFSNISHEILTMPVKVESLAIQQMKSEIRNLINNGTK